jgi:hypothetical protein
MAILAGVRPHERQFNICLEVSCMKLDKYLISPPRLERYPTEAAVCDCLLDSNNILIARQFTRKDNLSALGKLVKNQCTAFSSYGLIY